jgi:hypothetical protein
MLLRRYSSTYRRERVKVPAVNCANGNTDLLPRIIHAMLPKHRGLDPLASKDDAS